MGLKRLIHPDTLAAMRRPFYPVLMVHLDWPDGPVYAHSGVGPITWGGHTWRGVGKFGEIEIPGEAPGLAANSATLSLIGAPDDLFDLLADPILNRPGEIYTALTTVPGGNILVGEPIPLFVGSMDAMRYRLRKEDNALVNVIQVDLGSGPGARSKSAVLHSYEAQMDEYPGDTAGRHLINIEAETETMTWPA